MSIYDADEGRILLMPEIRVQCEDCGRVDDYHEIPTLQHPDGEDRTLCIGCHEKRLGVKLS